MENLSTGQAVLKSLNAPGFRGVGPGYVEVSRPPIELIGTLEIEREHFYVIIKLPPICFTLYRTQELLYGHITEFLSRVDVGAGVDMNKYRD